MNDGLIAEFWKNKEVERTPLLRKWSKLYGPQNILFWEWRRSDVGMHLGVGAVYIYMKNSVREGLLDEYRQIPLQ